LTAEIPMTRRINSTFSPGWIAVLKLLALFVLVPFAELVLLLKLADYTSISFTLGLIVLTGVVGTMLARHQGWRTMQSIQQQLESGKLPTEPLLDAAMIFFAGALLLTPGVLTDAFGLSLLIPLCRRFYRQRLSGWIRRNFHVQSFNYDASGKGSPAEDDDEVDSYVVEQQDKIDKDS
jgi:UPF0716 protein FxsA